MAKMNWKKVIGWGVAVLVVIGVVGDNVNKPSLTPAAERLDAIRRLYADVAAIEVRPYYGLAVDLAREVQAQFFIKGVRSVKDFEYEREQADVNRTISGVDTLLLLAEPQLAHISSSIVRELLHFGQDVSPFLPKP